MGDGVGRAAVEGGLIEAADRGLRLRRGEWTVDCAPWMEQTTRAIEEFCVCDHCGCRNLTPIAKLMNEHDRLRELTGHIRSHLAAGEDDAARVHFEEVLVVLGPHVAREEGALFPMLAREPDLSEHVLVLEGEHAELYDAVDDLDDAAADAGDGMTQAWRDSLLRILHELGEHMFKEDFGLFPAALATLDGADWDAVDRWEQENGSQTPVNAG